MIRVFYKSMVFAVLVVALPLPAAAFENLSTTLSKEQQDCYALAMVGMDSVINSRLGVLPDHVVSLASHPVNLNSQAFDHNLLNVILTAYLWKETPHSYAINVFYKCAQKIKANKQAMIDQ